MRHRSGFSPFRWFMRRAHAALRTFLVKPEPSLFVRNNRVGTICLSTQYNFGVRKTFVPLSSVVSPGLFVGGRGWPYIGVGPRSRFNGVTGRPCSSTSCQYVVGQFASDVVDSSLDVVAMQAPPGHSSDPTRAAKMNIHALYEYSGEDDRRSTMTFVYAPCAPELSLTEFLESDLAATQHLYPRVTVEELKLPPDVTVHCDSLSLPHFTYGLSSEGENVSDCLVWSFRSGSGVWTLAWHCARSVYMVEPDPMFIFIQGLRLTPRSEA